MNIINSTKKSIQLGEKIIHPNSKPYIIAEIGVNHEGSIDQAKYLIDLAKEGGADAAKFQSYKAETLASRQSPAYWDTTKEPIKSQHELFKKYDQFKPEDYAHLAQYCKTINIDFVSTPFDDDAVEFLNPLMSFYKIASADITNIPFLQKIASKCKPIVLSTGASTLSEIDIALDTLRNSGSTEIAILHCILNYPTPFVQAHLRMITGLLKAYPQYIIGYSDHTLPDESMTSLMTAYLLGAVIIEKHFTDDKTKKGNDHYHAMDVDDLKSFVELINKVYELLGEQVKKEPIKSEKISRLNARRSIVLSKYVKKGQILSEDDLTYKRPGIGICPSDWDEVVGSTANADLNNDHVLKWSDITKK